MRFPSWKTALPLLLLASLFALPLGCGDDAPDVTPAPGVGAAPPPIPAPLPAPVPADDVGEELTAAEQ